MDPAVEQTGGGGDQATADQRRIDASVGTIVPDDISDLLPIILGSSETSTGAVVEKDISHYVTKGACSSDEEEDCRDVPSEHTGASEAEEEEGEQNCYVVLQEDPDEDEFGGFVDYDHTHTSTAPFGGLAGDRLAVTPEQASVVETTDTPEESADTNVQSVNIPPLTSGQISTIKDTMQKLKIRPRVGSDYMVDSLLRAKIRVGDELEH